MVPIQRCLATLAGLLFKWLRAGSTCLLCWVSRKGRDLPAFACGQEVYGVGAGRRDVRGRQRQGRQVVLVRDPFATGRDDLPPGLGRWKADRQAAGGDEVAVCFSAG